MSKYKETKVILEFSQWNEKITWFLWAWVFGWLVYLYIYSEDPLTDH